MEARPDAEPLDYPSVILCRQQEADDWLPIAPGEVAEAIRKTTLERAPIGSGVGHVCGSEDDFAEGGVYDEQEPPVRYGTSGLPLCCNPVVVVSGGPAVPGSVLFRVLRGRYVYGGPAVGGRSVVALASGFLIRSTLRVTTSVSITTTRGLYVYGGPGAGGRCSLTHGEGIKVYGGAGAGGRVRWNDLVEWVRSEAGTYTFTAEIDGPHIIECWGAGAGGNTNVDFGTFGAGGGGGSGAYVRSILSLVLGTDYDVSVALGTFSRGDGVGAGAPNSTFETTLVIGAGGHTGFLSNPGDGGRLDDCVGDIKFAGGHGGSGVGADNGGGGGGGAGPIGPGNSTGDNVGASATFQGGRGGDGQYSLNPLNGYSPGGGAGGFARVPTAESIQGADGQVRISWLPPE